jgi:signal transduction histidine kinase
METDLDLEIAVQPCCWSRLIGLGQYCACNFELVLLQMLDAERWCLAVEDTGPGIIPDEREKIFSEFYRISDTAHVAGTGLGLAVVKRAVELLGGKIQLDSEQGRGSRFEVILPRGAPTAHPTS